MRERKRTSNEGAQNAKKPRPAAAADEDKDMRRGVRERKRTSNGGAQNAKKHRPAAAADGDKENSPSAVSRCDRKRASKEEAQNPKKSRSAVAKDDELEDVFAFFDTHFEKPTREMQKQVPKTKAASKGRLVRDEEVWILRVALGNDAVWVRYASMQEAAEAVKEASYSTADITSIRTIVGKKLNEIPANSKRARCYLGFLWTDDESVSRKDETRDARTAIAEFGEGCWILHEVNGAKWQYFENTNAAAEEVKKVSGYQGQAVRLRLNTRHL